VNFIRIRANIDRLGVSIVCI